MSTVTPNFNWPVPQSTDLVKDGATAIEALGDSIDASLVDLKGGTTGQVLSKTSGTDMDFTWVTTDDANAIQNSIVDAKGDLISATANDTPARLAVGANGETLVADSSTSTGLRYQVPVNVNPVINSAMQVWQRGTSIACTTTSYTADRWQGYRAVAGSTVSRQVTNDTTNLPFIQYCARVQRDSGNTSTTAIYLAQSFESLNSIAYAGKTVTLSFYARSGANFTNPLVTRLYTGTGTDQNVMVSYTGSANPIAQNATLTTTWQRFSFTATLAATATELAVRFDYEPTGTAGANDYYEVTGVQLEVGSVATPFKTNGATIQGELAACQRYYYLHASGSSKSICSACYTTASQIVGSVKFPVTMRTSPTLVATSGTNYYRFSKTGTDDDFNSLTIINSGENAAEIYNNSEVSGTAGYGGPINTLNASASVAFSAEL